MIQLESYTTPGDFLKAAASLEQEEMKHNVILGNCYNMLLENRRHTGCYFLTVFSENNLLASSVKISPKVILAAAGTKGLRELFAFYKDKEVPYSGVIGNADAAEFFASLDGRTPVQQRTTLVQALERTNPLSLAPGALVEAGFPDLPLLKEWTVNFFRDEQLLPERTEAQIQTYLETLVRHKNLVAWKKNGRIVSMGAVIRNTKNTGIIGLVYTPKEERGKGYAKACVHQLSNHILKTHKQSGLLVFSKNEAARHIYERIGYTSVSELSDIDFERN